MIAFYLSVIDTDEEKQKFTVVYETWRKAMYYAALKVTHDHGLAEDALQDAYLYIAKNIRKIGDPRSAETKAYLILTADSQAKKLLRKRREIIDSDLVEDAAWNGGGDVEDAFFDRFDEEELSRKIEALPEEYRTPLLLFYAKGFSGREIAEMLGLKEPTVRKRVERAKKLLADALKNDDA